MKVDHDKVAKHLRSGRASGREGSATLSVGVDHDKIAQQLGAGRPGKGVPAGTAVVDHAKIAEFLGVESTSPVRASANPIEAAALAIHVAQTLRSPARGGKPTDPTMTERRLVAMKPETLEGLNELAERAREKTGTSIQPMQIAAAVLERFVNGSASQLFEEMLMGPLVPANNSAHDERDQPQEHRHVG